MRTYKWLVFHCTAGPQNQKPETILRYWRNVKGWKAPGYHFLITADGTIHELLPIEKISNGVAGFNSSSIHIAYTGGVEFVPTEGGRLPVNALGVPVDNRTPEQKASQLFLLNKFRKQFPEIKAQGHRDFSPDKNRNGIIEPSEWLKACPSFSVAEWLKEVTEIKTPTITNARKTTAGVNIRIGPGVNFQKAAPALPAGTGVIVIATDFDWSFIQVNDCLNGWVASRYLI